MTSSTQRGNEIARMMHAWTTALSEGHQTALATIVGIRGSSYRKLGAQFLVTDDGVRVGSVSGGCLELDISRKAFWWLSDRDFYLKTYDTQSVDDGFGLGCGGSIDLLIERLTDNATNPLLIAKQVNETRESAVIATKVTALNIGHREILRLGESQHLGQTSGRFFPYPRGSQVIATSEGSVFLQAIEPPISLLVCGAGFDAQPLVRFASDLGWFVTVVDRRYDFAQPSRFPEADQVLAITGPEAINQLRLDSRTAAVIMSHSFTQDLFFLEQLAKVDLRYVGLMGARSRTETLLDEALAIPSSQILHAPVGLDLGAETPEQIALAIVAEIVKTFQRGLPALDHSRIACEARVGSRIALLDSQPGSDHG